MRALLGAGTERAAFRRLWSRLDQITGYPRTLAESEITRTGPASQRAPRPYIESLFYGLVHDDTGATILHGAIALVVDELPDGLLRRRIEHGGTTRTLAEWIQRGRDTRGWEVRSDLPGQPEAWTIVQPRDGAVGSATGEPIPEGEE